MESRTYPGWRYDGAGNARIIHLPAEEEEGWETTPADHGVETAAGKIPDPDIAAKMREEPADPSTTPSAKRRK
jgi:hypothetical protein